MPRIVANSRIEIEMTPLPDGQPPSVFVPDSPLTLWRTRIPALLCRKDAASVRMALCGTRIEGETNWREAISGEDDDFAAIAIGICIRQAKKYPFDAPEIDISVSAVLAYALLGDAASAVVMSWALKNRAKFDRPCALYSDLWLVSNF